MTKLSRNGGILAALLAAGCSTTGHFEPSQPERRVVVAPPQQPLPYFSPDCSSAKPTESSRGLGDPSVYHDVCRTGWDGRVTPLPFSVLLGGDDSNMTASFRFTAAVLSQRSRDILSFPTWVKPSHFEPIPWNSATDGPRRTEPGIKGEFRVLGNETVMFTPPGQTNPEKCVPVSFTLPPQDTTLGRIAGTTTRLLRCASDNVYRVPTFGS
jgi:hypothetical protein